MKSNNGIYYMNTFSKVIWLLLILSQVVIILFFTELQGIKYSSQLFLIVISFSNVFSYLLLYKLTKGIFRVKENILFSIAIFVASLILPYLLGEIFFLLLYFFIVLYIFAIIFFLIKLKKLTHH